MIKNVFLFLASVMLVPLTMFADQQLEFLKKQANASIDYWPYVFLYTVAPLVFTFAALGLLRALTLTPRQKLVVGAGYLLLGLFVICYPMIVIFIPVFEYLPVQWLDYRDLVRMVGAVYAVMGLFQVLEGRTGRNGSDT